MVRKVSENDNVEPVSNKKKVEMFDELIKMVNKEIKSDTGTLLAKLSDRPLNVKTIPTGSLVLDSIIGGGFPVGRIIEIYGPEASGKSSVALNAVGNVQKNGGTAVYIDLENALDPKYAKKLGVDIDNLAVAQPETAEQTFDLAHALANSGVVDIIVIDSVASMVPQKELENGADKDTIGLLARLMSRELRKLIGSANRNNTTIIFVNQTRDQIGGFSPFGTPQTTPGGKALKFYASLRIDVKRREQVKEGKTIIGNKVKMTVKKNKIAPPFMEGETVLTFGRGINLAAEMIEVGPKYGVIERPNNRKYVEAETQEVIGNSKPEAIEKLDSDKELLNRLSNALAKKIEDSAFDTNISVGDEDDSEEEYEINEETGEILEEEE